jgi:Mycothiol maleylpyruvate isomerase N-terminal domain
MTTGTRSYEEIVDALDEALEALEATLGTLSEEDWARPTLLTPVGDAPPWTVLELAAHMDVFMGIALGLMAEPEDGPPTIDGPSFNIASSDGSQGAMLYQYMADHAKGQTPGTMLETVHGTFKQALESARASAPDTVGPAFYGLIRLDEFLVTRIGEAVIHGLDLTDALGRAPLSMPKAVPIAAALLDEGLARTRVAGRPADLADDDLAFIRAASGRGEHPDPRFPIVR